VIEMVATTVQVTLTDKTNCHIIKNMIGQKFWEKTIAQYTKGSFVKQNALTHDGDKLIFSFCNHPATSPL
jgi:hypothetical protein